MHHFCQLQATSRPWLWSSLAWAGMFHKLFFWPLTCCVGGASRGSCWIAAAADMAAISCKLTRWRQSRPDGRGAAFEGSTCCFVCSPTTDLLNLRRVCKCCAEISSPSWLKQAVLYIRHVIVCATVLCVSIQQLWTASYGSCKRSVCIDFVVQWCP